VIFGLSEKKIEKLIAYIDGFNLYYEGFRGQVLKYQLGVLIK